MSTVDDSLPTEFDLIVIGTGLTESILAAAASRIGKTVLHLDSNDYYGGLWASFNLEGIETLANNNKCGRPSANVSVNNGIITLDPSVNFVIENAELEWRIPANILEIGNKTDDEKIDEQTEERNDELENLWTRDKVMHDFRKFNIDLTPKLLFARGDLVELLISSNISRYAEFRAVDRIITCINNEMKVVPCSRADVFTNKDVTVLEKRLLMKVLSNCMSTENEEEFKDFEDKTFRSYLEHKRLTQNLIHYILYSIGMCDDQTLCSNGVKRVKKFLQSLGRYGNSPFLFPMYGCGEIPQCFCRLSAVFGGIYCLKRPITEIHLNESLDEFHAIKCNEQTIKAKSIVISGTEIKHFAHILPKKSEICNSDAAHQCGKLSRAIFILTRPLCNQPGSTGGGVEFLKLPPIGDEFAVNGNESTGAFVIQLTHWSGTVPKDLYLVHITCRSRSDSPKSDIEPYERLLFNDDESHEVLWSMYFNIPTCVQCADSIKLPSNCRVACGPFFELDYDESIQQAKHVFTQIFENEEFLPRAPDPEEIIIEGDNPTDPLPSMVAELNLDLPNTQPNESDPQQNQNEEESNATIVSSVQNVPQQE